MAGPGSEEKIENGLALRHAAVVMDRARGDRANIIVAWRAGTGRNVATAEAGGQANAPRLAATPEALQEGSGRPQGGRRPGGRRAHRSRLS